MTCSSCGKKASELVSADQTNATISSKFGRCTQCFVFTIVGLVIAMLLIIPLLFVDLPTWLAWMGVLPTVFFSVWLMLHVIVYLRNRFRSSRSIL